MSVCFFGIWENYSQSSWSILGLKNCAFFLNHFKAPRRYINSTHSWFQRNENNHVFESHFWGSHVFESLSVQTIKNKYSDPDHFIVSYLVRFWQFFRCVISEDWRIMSCLSKCLLTTTTYRRQRCLSNDFDIFPTM